MENRSFDHMLGSLKAVSPAIDGYIDSDPFTNPDANNNPVKPQALAEFQGQLNPDPDHHFPAVDVQIFGGQTGAGRGAGPPFAVSEGWELRASGANGRLCSGPQRLKPVPPCLVQIGTAGSRALPGRPLGWPQLSVLISSPLHNRGCPVPSTAIRAGSGLHSVATNGAWACSAVRNPRQHHS